MEKLVAERSVGQVSQLPHAAACCPLLWGDPDVLGEL